MLNIKKQIKTAILFTVFFTISLFANDTLKNNTILFSSIDSANQYLIELIEKESRKVNSSNYTRYIILQGNLKDISNNLNSNFVLSIDSNYIDKLDSLFLKVSSIKNKKISFNSSTDFLGKLNINKIYEINLNINNNSLLGELVNEKELPDFVIKNMQNSMPTKLE